MLAPEYQEVLDLAVGLDGRLHVLDQNMVYRVETDGSQQGLLGVIRDQGPHSLAVDAQGAVYVTYAEVGGIRFASAETRTMGGITAPDFVRGLAIAADGAKYAVDAIGQRILKTGSSGRLEPWIGPTDNAAGFEDGDPARARFRDPGALALGADGRLFVLDMGNSAVRAIAPNGQVETLAGRPTESGAASGTADLQGPRGMIRFRQPSDITVDTAGRVFIADMDRVRMIGTGGWVSTVVTGGSPCIAQVPQAENTCDEQGKPSFGAPRTIAAGPNGVLYLADSAGRHVWRLRPRS
jgi:sugar lactone lactonase YvrE